MPVRVKNVMLYKTGQAVTHGINGLGSIFIEIGYWEPMHSFSTVSTNNYELYDQINRPLLTLLCCWNDLCFADG